MSKQNETSKNKTSTQEQQDSHSQSQKNGECSTRQACDDKSGKGHTQNGNTSGQAHPQQQAPGKGQNEGGAKGAHQDWAEQKGNRSTSEVEAMESEENEEEDDAGHSAGRR